MSYAIPYCVTCPNCQGWDVDKTGREYTCSFCGAVFELKLVEDVTIIVPGDERKTRT